MQRYFDGTNWTPSYAPAAAPVPPKPASSTGRTLATVLGVVAAVLVLGFIGIAVLVDIGEHHSDATFTPRPNPSNDAGSTNQAVSDGKFTFTVTGVDEQDSLGVSKPRGRFVIVNITVKNTSKQEQSFQVNNQMLIGSNGAKYRADWMAATSINKENTLLLALGPGFAAKYRLPFDLLSDITPAKIELHDSALSGGATVKLS